MEMTKKEEKEIGTLLGVGNAFIPVHTFNKEEYVALFAFKEAIKGLEQEKENLSELNRKQSKAFKETMKDYRELLRDYMKIGEENKKLKAELSKNKVERWSLKKDCENKKEQQKIALKSMENQIRELKETLGHRDSILSIMYDLLRSGLSDYEQLCMIDVVIDVEVGNEPQNKLREELLDRFWKRDF